MAISSCASHPLPANEIFMVSVVPKGAAPNSLSTMAQKVPQYKKVRDQAENNKRHRCRDAIMKIVDFALKHASQRQRFGNPLILTSVRMFLLMRRHTWLDHKLLTTSTAFTDFREAKLSLPCKISKKEMLFVFQVVCKLFRSSILGDSTLIETIARPQNRKQNQ